MYFNNIQRSYYLAKDTPSSLVAAAAACAAVLLLRGLGWQQRQTRGDIAALALGLGLRSQAQARTQTQSQSQGEAEMGGRRGGEKEAREGGSGDRERLVRDPLLQTHDA